MKLLKLSWEDTVRMCEKLAEKVSEYRPDILVGISRGALVPLRILSDVLDIDNVGVLGIKLYKKIGERADFPRITQELTIPLKGKKVLLVDDVADSGKSLLFAKEYIERKGASKVAVATIHYKPTSLIRPEYFVGITTAWVVYPWERYEAERELKRKKVQTL